MANQGQSLLAKDGDIKKKKKLLHTLQIMLFWNTLKDFITAGNGLIFVLCSCVFNQTLFMAIPVLSF